MIRKLGMLSMVAGWLRQISNSIPHCSRVCEVGLRELKGANAVRFPCDDKRTLSILGNS